MNFVIMAYSFPPRNGPECFCSGRFASALANTGHSVHVVTMDHARAVSDEVYNTIVDPRIKITRVPMVEKKKRIWPRLRYRTTQWESADYGAAIETLREVLRKYEKPILISRSNPESSHIIACHACDLAYKWIAHFSDPIPFWSNPHGIKSRLRMAMTLYWMRRTLKNCHGVSLTCHEVVRYYHETYGAIFDNKPIFINYHVGEPPLNSVGGAWTKPFPEKYFVHMGMINPARGVSQIIEALNEINKDGLRLRFVQVGECCQTTRKLFDGRDDVLVLDSVDPALGAVVANSADISLIPDVQIDLPYTPFMPSKYVYQLFADKPLVLLTRDGSPMANVSKDHPQAGLFIADYTKKGDLAMVLKRAAGFDISKIDRTSIRNLFTRNAVADGFIGKLKSEFNLD